ncbi:MAG TPA: cytochrome c [Cyclobacteriaceae bacterium]|nr:cytochrome c [Cyclobacteriaceae bacterium]
MIKKLLLGFGALVALAVLLISGLVAKAYYTTEQRMNRTYAVKAQSLPITTDSAQLAYGDRLMTAKGCRDCHGEDLGGKVFIDDAPLGFLVGKNLTKGKGGLPSDHDISDWVLALKHGIRKDGKPLLFMPSHEYTLLSEQDMSAIVSFAVTLPEIDREFPEQSVGPVGRVLTDLGKLPLFPVEMIDHSRSLEKVVTVEISPAYGKYLSTACQGCHRPNMKGGDPVAPGFPPVADISSTGHVGKWTQEQFIQTLRTGVTPEGKTLKPTEMPWNMTAAYTDVELKALLAYLQSI